MHLKSFEKHARITRRACLRVVRPPSRVDGFDGSVVYAGTVPALGSNG